MCLCVRVGAVRERKEENEENTKKQEKKLTCAPIPHLKKKKTNKQLPKQEIKEVIELPIKHPELFDALGVAQPKGVLLYGPPGTGKTLLARAVAHHTDCTFIRVSGSELVQKYIGEGSRMVRELFVMAREHAPSIIFMDEVSEERDGRERGGERGGTFF